MAEAGDRGAKDAILRIIQRDPLPEKHERAEKLLARFCQGSRQKAGSTECG
jgi:hypothetical protein